MPSPTRNQNMPSLAANKSVRKDFEQLLETAYKHELRPSSESGREHLVEYLFETAAHQKKWNDGFYAWRNMLKRKRGQDYAMSRHLALLSTGPVTLNVYYCTKPTKERIMKPVQIKRYPDYMIQAAIKCGKRLEIVLESEQAATAMRFSFYGLRRAIEKEQAEAQFPDFMRATLLVRDNRLIISPPEHSSDTVALAFAKALEQAPEPTYAGPVATPYTAQYATQAQDTTAFEDAIEAWLSAPAPGLPKADSTPSAEH